MTFDYLRSDINLVFEKYQMQTKSMENDWDKEILDLCAAVFYYFFSCIYTSPQGILVNIYDKQLLKKFTTSQSESQI